MSDPILRVADLSRYFGGLRALDGLGFDLPRGQILGLIGPNGAGKTTLFNVLIGIHRRTTGSVELEGREVGGLKPHRIAAYGMTKTFQNVALFTEMSVLDNVLTGALLRHDLTEARGLAERMLQRVGLAGVGDKIAGDLSFPERARVEVARALCTEPKILLLDEAMAALTSVEMEAFLGLIRALREEGLTLIVVEHHMKAIMSLCDRILVLNFGRLIADGAPGEVARDPAVLEAYLGKDFEAPAAMPRGPRERTA